jgi:hypothetical protein
MLFLNSVVSWFFKMRYSQITHFKANPIDVQQDLLKKLVHTAKGTRWGKMHGFSSIENYRDFSERAPLQEYNDIKPFVDRMIQGETNLLWPTEIRWFAKSSGTTSDKSKFIPISDESLEDCHFKAGKDVLSIFSQNNPDTQIFDGKGLIMGGSQKVSEINNRVYFGDLSAVLLQNYPSWLEFLRTPDVSLALIEDWEEKLEKIAKATIHENVTSLSGVPSWNLILLKRILELSGKNHIIDIWPNLELFIHGGVSFVPYRQQFQQIIGSPKMIFMETYNASEGFFGIQDQPDSNELLLMLDYGIFYEFIPMDEFDKSNPKVIPLESVETGTNYAIVISTNGGLWRYIIGDTVRFTNLSPYRIVISGRTKNFINAFGEEVIIDNTDTALAAACNQTGAIISEYTAAPIFLSDIGYAAHEYLIEFEREPDNLSHFIDILDAELKNVNSDYEAKRSHDLLLQKPKVTVAPKNTFFKWLKSRGKIGGQNKVPRLYNDRKYLEELLTFVTMNT